MCQTLPDMIQLFGYNEIIVEERCLPIYNLILGQYFIYLSYMNE